MTTTTSCNKLRFDHMLKGLVKRNRSLMVLWFFLGFFCLPFQYGMSAFRMADYGEGLEYVRLRTYGGGGLYTEFSLITICLLWIAAAAVVAMVQTSYMQNRRAVDLYHSLPLTRPQLLGANYLAAFITVALPMTVNYAITMVMAAIRTHLVPQEVGMDLYSFGYYTPFTWGGALFGLVTWLVALGGMLSVAFFVATQAGSVFDTLIFCGVILLAPAGIILINYMLCEMFLYGYVFNMDMGLIFALSPLTLGLTYFFEAIFGGGSWEPDKWATLIWLTLDVMIFAGAAAAYRRRPSERAESPSRSGPISVLVRLLTLTIACPPLGVAFSYGITGDESVFHILMGTVIVAVLLFFVMEAVLNRGTKGILKAAPLCLALTVAVTGYTGVMANGGFGYETYLPPVEQVQHLTLNYRGRFNDVNFSPISTENERVEEDKYGREQVTYNYSIQSSVDLEQDETLAIAQELQATIVRQYREKRAQEQAGPEVEVVEVAADPAPVAYTYEYDRLYSYGSSHETFTFDYTMEDGSTVRRRYRAELTPEVQELLGKLSSSQEMNEKCNPLQNTSAVDYNSITVDGWLGLESMTFDSKADMEKLLAALRSDVERESWAQYQNPDKEVKARLYLDSAWERRDNKTPIEKDFFDDCSIYVTADYTNTLAALKQLGCGGIMEKEPENIESVYLFAMDYMLGYESNLALLTTGWYSSEDRAMVEEWEKEMPEYMLLKEGQDARAVSELARHVVSSGEETMLVGMVFEDNEGRISAPMMTSVREMTEAGYKDMVYELERLYDNKY